MAVQDYEQPRIHREMAESGRSSAIERSFSRRFTREDNLTIVQVGSVNWQQSNATYWVGAMLQRPWTPLFGVGMARSKGASKAERARAALIFPQFAR